MKYIKQSVLIIFIVSLIALTVNIAIFPIGADNLHEKVHEFGTLVDQASTKGSVLYLMDDGSNNQMKLIHYQVSPLFHRYRLAEVISFTPDNDKHYGFADLCHVFAVKISNNEIIVSTKHG